MFVALVTVALVAAASYRLGATQQWAHGFAAYGIIAGVVGSDAIGLAESGFPLTLLAGVLTAVVSGFTDLTTGLVFDEVTLVGLILVLVAAIDAGAQALSASVAGSLGGFALLGIPYLVTRGRGLGLGDVKLGAVMGAALGCCGVAEAIAASFVIGAIGVLPALVLGRRELGSRVAFAPYLAAGTIVVALAAPFTI